MFKLNIKFDADLLPYWFSHFECDGHTVHVFTQQRLLPPLTSTVKSSWFTHVCSSPLSLAARLHRCPANHSHYINNGWTFSGQTSYKFNSIFLTYCKNFLRLNSTVLFVICHAFYLTRHYISCFQFLVTLQ